MKKDKLNKQLKDIKSDLLDLARNYENKKIEIKLLEEKILKLRGQEELLNKLLKIEDADTKATTKRKQK